MSLTEKYAHTKKWEKKNNNTRREKNCENKNLKTEKKLYQRAHRLKCTHNALLHNTFFILDFIRMKTIRITNSIGRP